MASTSLINQRALAALTRGSGLKSRVLRSVATKSSFPSQSRIISTQVLKPDEEQELLNNQRKFRPNSPHLTIYQPQLTWYSSIANRITGAGLSAGVYAGALGYLALPALGIPFDGAHIIETIALLPTWFKFPVKFLVGGAFWYHTFNGLRHLAWDMGYVLSLKASYAAGYTVIAASFIASVATALI